MIPRLKIKTLRVSPAACSLIQQPAFVLYTQTHTIKHKHTLGACFLLPAVLFFFGRVPKLSPDELLQQPQRSCFHQPPPSAGESREHTKQNETKQKTEL